MSRAHYQPPHSLSTDPIHRPEWGQPGGVRCQFLPNEWTPCPLLAKIQVSPTSYLLRFQLPNPSQPLNLSTCSCILARTTIQQLAKDSPSDTKEEDVVVIRPYTPISTNQLVGCFDILVKDYGPQSSMSHTLCQKVPMLGTSASFSSSTTTEDVTTVSFSHSPANVKIQASSFVGRYDHIVLLAGGTGITPMIQALHALLAGRAEVLGDEEEEKWMNDSPNKAENESLRVQPHESSLGCRRHLTKITLLYGSKTQDDILARPLLDRWKRKFQQQLTVEYILSEEPTGSSWIGKRGHIDRDLLHEYGIRPRPRGQPPPPPNHTGAAAAATTTGSKDDTSVDGKSVLVMVCGPPPFYESLCGPRDERDTISGILGHLGFSSDEVYKF